jgi:hypothetical protein
VEDLVPRPGIRWIMDGAHGCLRRLGCVGDVLLVLLDVVGKVDKGFPYM